MHGECSQLESSVIQLAAKGDWIGARRLLADHINSPSKDTAGVAHYFLGTILYSQAGAYAEVALSHLDHALQCLPLSSRYRAAAGIQAVMICHFTEDRERAALYMGKVQASLTTRAPAAECWRGEFYYQLALLHRNDGMEAVRIGNHQGASSLFDQARELLDRCISFYAKNKGPHNDTVCRVLRAETLRVEVDWNAGKRAEAVSMVKPLLPMLKDRMPHAYTFWCARVALVAGALKEAAEHLCTTITNAVKVCDHFLTAQTIETLGEVYVELGQWAELEAVVSPLREEAAAVFNPWLVYRLDCLLAKQKVGRSENEDSQVHVGPGSDAGICAGD